MRLLPSDPDVETIVSRIKASDIDLQPEFQRGEVWGKAKKQRLIDTILRDWHIPPIHVIENPKTSKQEVLDGQQRLTAIRDFVENAFPVDGKIEPIDPSIRALDGKYYRQLSQEWKRKFNQFTIRVFRIVDYRASEPAEIFFRLNQPASLTSAEQRNAFFGPVREQIKELVGVLEESGLDKHFLGFSNSRMAYDDVLSRTALAVQRRSLAGKITAGDLQELYRSDEHLGFDTIGLVQQAIGILGDSRRRVTSAPKFNKATLFSWLMFIVRANIRGYPLRPERLGEFLNFFDDIRSSTSRGSTTDETFFARGVSATRLLITYESRSSARVADVSSVILRDAVLWLVLKYFLQRITAERELAAIGVERILAALEASESLGDDEFAKQLIASGWGELS
jgi:Protein of unknown function DUF262